MPVLRTEVIIEAAGMAPADFATNTLYYQNDSAGGLLPVDYTNHAQEVCDAYSGQWNQKLAYVVNVYDMTDAEPRPIRGSARYTPTGGTDPVSNYGPPQVAIVIAFYADRNIVGRRAHIYLGPWPTAAMTHTFGPTERQALLDGFVNALWNVGGANVYHVVYHTKDGMHGQVAGSSEAVTDYWIDDRWDTQRRRCPKPTTRSTLHP